MKTLKNCKEWKVLTEFEQSALSLSYGYNKSSWQAGEVLGKSHYKYLELKARASFFLKMFRTYFNKHGVLIPPSLHLDPLVESYLLKTIGQRLKINAALETIDSEEFVITSYRNNLITREIQRVSNIDTLEAKDFINMVKDFDRWNNFRILPKELQEPTAYKRRNKHATRRLIKQMYNIDPLIFDALVERYSCEKAQIRRQVRYVPLFKPETHEILTLEIKPLYVQDFTKMGLYVFPTRIGCMKFHEIVGKYMSSKKRHCRDGQHFWPMFRVLIKDALNYLELQNLNPSRRLLEYAFQDKDKQRAEALEKNGSL